MIQNQEIQTNNPNYSITAEISEQELHDINGGCYGCEAVKLAADMHANHLAFTAGRTFRDSLSAGISSAKFGRVSQAAEASRDKIANFSGYCGDHQLHVNNLQKTIDGLPKPLKPGHDPK